VSFKSDKEIFEPGKTERALRELIENSLSGIVMLRAIRNTDGLIYDFEWELINPAAERMLHRIAENSIGKKLGDEIPDLWTSEWLRIYSNVVETGQPASYDYHSSLHGQDTWLHTTVVKVGEGVTITFNDISERKTSELELKENKQKLEAIFNQASQIIILLSLRGDIIDINQTALSFLGLKKEDVEGIDFWKGSWWPDSESNTAQMPKILQDALAGAPVRSEIEMIAGGRACCVDLLLKPILDEKGEIKQLVVEGNDVTARKEAVSRILQNEVLLTESQKMAHLGSWEWDMSSGNVLWSEELFRIFGYEPFEIRLDFGTYLSYVHPEDKKMVQEALEKTLHNFQPYDLQHRIVRSDKSVRWLKAAGKAMLSGRKKLLKLAGTALDITEQKHADMELLKSVSLYKTMARNMPDSAVLLFDKSLVLTLAEGSALKKIQYETSPVAGKSADEIYNSTQAAQYIPLLEKALQGEESTLEKVSNNRHFRMYIIPVRNSSDEIFACMKVLHDITEIKKYEKELVMRIEELHRSNQELEQFAYVASHDLQEPLRKIRAFGDRLATKYEEKIGEDGKIYVERMQSAASRMQTLIDDLLAFSRISRTTEPFWKGDIGGIISGILEDLEVAIEQKKAVITYGSFPEIEMIPTQIRQLFQNLISNALKFSRKDVVPRIEISAELVEGSQLPQARTMYRDATFCRITVKDNGIGFDNKYLDRIFIIFQRLHGRNEFEGTGIGLAICKKIAEYHNGFISAESKLNEGSRFEIFLPINQNRNE
jgi:PAS domain S-box-containing protein